MSVDTSKFIGETHEIEVSYNKRDLILYAIGIGCTDLRVVYENESEFAAFPTYAFVLPFKGTDQDIVSFPSPAMQESMNIPPLPGTKVGVDGERYLEVVNPLPAEGATLKLRATLIGIHKKGKGATIESETVLYDDQRTYIRMISGSFLVGARDFTPDSAGQSTSQSVPVPDRQPDHIQEELVSPHQTTLYRLSGDYNPLHIDPSFAQMSGFEQPILHGLCTLGFAVRHVLDKFAGGDVCKFKAVRLRFASPVLPGQTLQTHMWKNGNKIVVVVKVKESGKVVVNNAYVELRDTPSKL